MPRLHMMAIELSGFGGPDVLKPVERQKPALKAGEVLLQVHAAGVARADAYQRQGKYPPPPGASDIPGLDVAGVIEEVGPDVSRWQRGDRACAILAGGGYAEYAAVPACQVLPLPAGWTATEAATLPENLLTVYDNLITRAALRDGETVLIHGGASGIGTTTIMLSRAYGARVIVTAGSAEKCESCLLLGAHYAINYRECDFVAQVKQISDGHGVDVVLDVVGGAYLNRNLDCLATEGRIVSIATQGGRNGDLDIGRLMQKRARVMGSTMRARTPEQKGEVARAVEQNVWPLLTPKTVIHPVIDRTFALEDARLAHERLESGQHVGKIVLVTKANSQAVLQ